MSIIHLALALAVVIVWGTNFVIIKWGLNEFPSLFFASLRFFFSSIPWIFFIPKPDIPWRYLIANGGFLGFGLFGLLFIAMRGDISPGVASIVIQTQAFFTIGLSLIILGERLKLFQIMGLALCLAGLIVLFRHTDASLSVRGLILTLTGGLSWGISNLIGKKVGKINVLAYMVWSSVFAIPPLLIASFLLEGSDKIMVAISNATIVGWGAAAWQGLANTLFGYGAWNWLLARYPAAVVSPLSLLVPIFGMLTAAWLLSEPLPPWKIHAAILLLMGLAVISLWPKIKEKLFISKY